MMKRIAAALAMCLAAATASAAQKEFHAARSETVTATVKSVNVETRELVLTGADGSDISFKAGDKLRNLDKLKAGDAVKARFDQSLTLWILEKDQPAPELSVGADVFRAPEGQKPGGLMTADVSGVATVTAIAADKKHVTLKGPRGNSVKLAVQDPANLEGVAVGTRVGFSYSETLAVDVKPGKAPAKKAPAKSEKKGEKK